MTKQTADDDVLRDGERIRVPLLLMDSMQRAIKQDSTTYGRHPAFGVQSAEIVDAFGRGGLALHSPGFRYLSAPAHTVDGAVQATLRTMAADAYRAHDQEEARRWQGSGREIEVKRITGDPRRDAYLSREQHDANAWRRLGNKW